MLAVAVSTSPGDTLHPRAIDAPPRADGRLDSLAWGAPQVRIPVGQGTASVWLLRAADSLFIAIAVPDATPSWTDAVALCLDVTGDGGGAPGHDDFQWSFRRVLDSSVVYRGRNGRWAPPLDDPDWRLGADHEGGGWSAASAGDARGWTVVMRMDRAWLEGAPGRRPAVGFRVHDDDPNGWYPWPDPHASAGATLMERTPALWVPIGAESP